MGRLDKLERRIRRYLRDVRGEDLVAVLAGRGFVCRPTPHG